jgi:ATP-dependent DNA helicase RecQ
MATPVDLSELLQRVFGHREFRAHQRDVCEAAASGRDVLLVMPTGAGKSLCYQLPALARGGTALVISPLIALMDDQAGKLEALGLRVGRVHSGLSRDDARQACRAYLAGELDFLFIAPERMRVPGFPEMLAKRKPALVAIDEAHCISAWGHDFRPDYWTLGQWLPALRPAPVVALTATATPTVQRDIAVQLDLQEPAVFITGFRRENLAIEVVELSQPQRAEFAAKLLKDEAARPAIVYAGSRKQADEMAEKLGKHFPAAAYHAGLDGATRERVARAFSTGKLDVVVATVAFGMGVDKADVRTVVHVALPGSVEAYYQEIGRAGRDGLPSRTVLLHGFADRRLQEFFLERNYPPVGDVERVAQVLPAEWTAMDVLHNALRRKNDMMDRETMERAVEKLLGSGVAVMDIEGNVRAAEGEAAQPWQHGYESQVAARRTQIDRMVAFAESTQCRMRTLVEHFGDQSDKQVSCGKCDVCAPEGGGANAAHVADEQERRWLRAILGALAGRSTSTGKLFTELGIVKERREFDALLDGLARAGLIALANDTFRSPEGKDITYRKASITHEGREPDEAALDTVWLRGVISAAGGRGKRGGGKKAGLSTGLRSGRDDRSSRELEGEAARLFERLRGWRTEVAKPTKTPAFLILSDAVLRSLAVVAPETIQELHRVPGMGPAKVERFGAEVLRVCRGEAVAVGRGKSFNAEDAEEKRGGRHEGGDVGGGESVAVGQAVRLPVRQRVSAAVVVKPRPVVVAPVVEFSVEQRELEMRLREWRKARAAAEGLPSFFILSDTALRGIVELGPRSVEDLRSVRGMEAEKVAKFGAAVVELCRG